MLRIITRNNRLLLTGVLAQQVESEREKLKSTNEKYNRDGLKESANTQIINVLGLERNEEGKEISKYSSTKIELDAPITGWQRVKNTFNTNENKKSSPELYFITYLTWCGYIGGFLYGGMKENKKAVDLFLYSNDTTKFLGLKEARVALIKDSMKAFLKGGILQSPKTAALCYIFAASNIAMSAYSGKNGILEFSLAGSVTTLIMKWNLGIRGMISGCVSGGLSGLLLGTMISIFLSLAGSSISNIQALLYDIHKLRKMIISNNMKLNTRSEIEQFYSKKTEGLPIAFSDN